MLFAAASAVALVAGVFLSAAPPASAAFIHPAITDQFGPDGTSASDFGTGFLTSDLEYDQADKRLYVLKSRLQTNSNTGEPIPNQAPRGIFGFDLPAPGTHTPLGGNFPIPVLAPTYTPHLAVDESEGHIYYLDSFSNSNTASYFGALYGFDSSGSPLGGNFPAALTHKANDIAVDPLGYIWMAQNSFELDSQGHAINSQTKLRKYSPDGALLGSIDTTPFGPREIAVDGITGDIWAFGYSNGQSVIDRLTAASGYTKYDVQFSATEPSRMTFDSKDGILYTLGGSGGRSIMAFNESGSLVEDTLLPPIGSNGYVDIAVNEETGELYLLRNGSSCCGGLPEVVSVLSGVIVPDVTTGEPSGVGHTSATVTGHVDPASGPGISDCKFQYADADSFNEIQTLTISGATGGNFVIWAWGPYTDPIPYNASAAIVQSALEALPTIDPGDVSVNGPDGGPYTIEFTGALGASDIPAYGANATDINNGADLTPSGATATLTTTHQGGNGNWDGAPTAPCVPAVSPGSPISAPTDVSADLTGLITGITYRYRLLASNSNGQNIGLDKTVTPQATLTVTGDATAVSRTGATLNGSIDPDGLTTTYYFEYGKNKNYGQTSTAPPGADLGTADPGAQPASSPISSLDPGSTYHYRLVAVNSAGTSYGVDRSFATPAAVKDLSTDAASPVGRESATLHGTLDPDGMGTLYYFEYGETRRYGQSTSVPPGDPLADTSPGDQQLSGEATGLKVQTTYHYRLVASNAIFGTTYGNDATFTTPAAVKDISTETAGDVTPTSATLNGKLDPDGYQTTYYFQWGKTKDYGHSAPAPPGADAGTTDPGILSLDTPLTDLEPGTTYHFRIVASNTTGTSFGGDQSFSTPQGPSIEGLFSANVTADGADLKARINPHGFDTTYRFEYGTTTNYGQSAPVPDGDIAAAGSAQSVAASLNGLQDATYHFHLLATNKWGTVASEDQTFSFNPPNCPNATLRQQTGAAYLPDCRAYELVSPAHMGGALIDPDAPTSPTALDRFAFGAGGIAIPDTGDPPNGVNGDLYVASRTNEGWVTRYVGLPANQTFEQGDLPHGKVQGLGVTPASAALDRFLTWQGGGSSGEFAGASGANTSFAPYMWNEHGDSLGRLPTNLAQVPGGDTPVPQGGFEGDNQPSADFSHYVFSAIHTAFAPGGLTASPGSVYDDDLGAKTVSIVSKTASGADIASDPFAGAGSGEYVLIPAVSTNGTHILMSTAAPGGLVHLYMRVNDAVSYDVSRGADSIEHGVKFEGMTADGSEIYFTTAAQMTADDHDTSVDLYRWSENNGAPSLTRLSVGSDGDAGDTDACNAGWDTLCGVEVVSTVRVPFLSQIHSVDNALAANSGDIYFYSPETLDGARGVPGLRNLYRWRQGVVHHVATLDSGGEALRIDVSPDGSHMAFVTKTRLGAYDNAGHAEMYSYDSAARKLLCVSCKSDGSPPTDDVDAAQNGLFQTYDGRTFFSTSDALVPRDANGIEDVYEYAGGRAQLISTGTGADYGPTDIPTKIGLVGVSGDGTNAFISTYETLVGQDENGPFLKFYDARVSGGFPFNKPAAPCAAADECHGAGSSTPGQPGVGSGVRLGSGGNYTAPPQAKKKRKQAKKHKHRAHKKHRRHKRHTARKAVRR